GQLTRISYPDGAFVAYGYDTNGNRISMTDSWGTTDYVYDAFNRLAAVYFPGLNPVQYQYDEAHNLTRITYPNSQAVDYGYDTNNRLISVIDSSGATAYGYDLESGNLITKTLPNGIYTTYGYDTDGRLTDVGNRQADGSLIASYHYTLDDNGNRTAVTEQTPGETGTTTYEYDELYRLVEVTYHDSRHVTYEYDSLGNRLAMTDTVNGVTHYTYDSDNRLLQAGDEFFLYDANGNTIQRSSPERTITYSYDYENRLVGYDNGETAVEFIYDGDGNRVAKIVDGEHINYVNDVNGALTQVLLEADAGWYVDKSYTLGPDRINQMDWSGNPTFYLYDSPLRSVTALTDSAGALMDSYEYDTFGTPLGSGTNVDNSFLYNGEQYDPEIGLIYLRNRYYDPATGRFLSRDRFPGWIARPKTSNPYVFVHNDPVNFVDPSGDIALIDTLVAAGIGGVINLGGAYVGDIITNFAEGGGFWESFMFRSDWQARYTGAFVGGATTGAMVTLNPFAAAATGSAVGNTVTQILDSNSGFDVGSLGADVATGVLFNWVGGLPFSRGPGRPAQRLTTKIFGKISQNTNWKPGLTGAGLDVGWGQVADHFANDRLIIGGEFGGVSLDLTAELLLNIEDIAGATYDPATGQIVFFGQEDVTLPPMETDDLAVAVHSVYGGQDPGVSIGTEPSEIPGEMKVRYDGQTVETYFGWVMFESDRALKILSLGQDNITGLPVTSNVPGYMNMLDRELASGDCDVGESSNRMWFRPKEVRLVRSADGISMVFDEVSMELLTESTFEDGVVGDPEAEAFAAHFTEHYDEFAAEFPILKELKRLGKIVAVVKWVRDNDIPMDVSFLDNYIIAFYDTPAYTPETTVSDSNNTCIITITGGVTYRPPNEYLADDPGDPLTNGMSDAALDSRPDETEFMWDFTPPASAVQTLGMGAAEEFTAVAQSLARSRKDGNFTLPQTDMAFPIEGNLSLNLTRYYNSFYDEPSGFGQGWAETPYQLLFPGYEQTYTFGNAITKTLHTQITVIERPAGREDVYTLLGLDDANLAIYARPGSAGLLRDNDDDTFTLTRSDETQVRFDDAGRLIAIADRNGNQVVYSYTNDALVQIYQPGGRQIVLSYNSQGQIIQAAGPGGRTIAYTYDANGYLETAVNAVAGQTITYTYDAEGRLIRAEDNRGNTIFDLAFDVYGRATTQTFGGAADFDLAYNLNERRTVITDPNDNATQRAFDPQYRLLSSTDPLSNTLDIAYAGDFGPSVITDTLDAQTQYFYDVHGNVAAVLDDQGNLTNLYYDINDNLIAAEDPGGIATAFGYDANNNLTTIYHEVSLVLDGNGDLVSFYYNPDNVTLLAYDEGGNLVSVTDPEGNLRQFDYDDNGVMNGITEASGLGTDMQYDALSRLAQISNDAGQSVSLGYDDADNVTSINTIAGTVEYSYDGNNNLASVTDANGNQPTYFDYDARNNLSQVTDAAGETTDYAYDVMGNLISATLPNNSSLSYDYDELNRVARVVHGASVEAPDIALTPNVLDFGRVQHGDDSTMTLTVLNQGAADLALNNLSSNNSAFSSNFSNAVTILAGSSANFAVTFTPSGRGAYNGVLTVQSDDPDEGTLTVSLDGEGKQIISGLTAVSADNGVVLSWDPFEDAANDFNHFNIYREETPIMATVAGLTPIDQSISASQVVTFTDRTAVPDSTYYYAITAVYDDGYEDPEVEPADPVTFMTGVDLVGSIISISALGQSEYKPRAAQNTNTDEYLVVWEYDSNGDGSNFDILAARLQADGEVTSTGLIISGSSYHDRRPDIIYNSAANEYLVVWEYDYYGDNSNFVVLGQRVAADGALIGSAFFVGGYVNHEYNPRIAYNSAANNYLVIWEYDYNGDGSNYIVLGQLVSADGGLVGDAIFVGGYLNHELKPGIAYNSAANNYLVVWEYDYNGDGSDYDILGQQILADGSLSGSAILISGFIDRHELKPQLAYNSDDNEYLAVFELDYYGDASDYDAIGQRITASGTLAGETFFVGGFYNHERNPQIAYNGAINGYLVVWEYDFYGDSSDWDIVGQRLANGGNKQGKAYFISGTVGRDELKPHLVYNASANEYLAVWEYDYFGDSSDWDIRGRRVGGAVPLLHIEPVALDFGDETSSMPLTITNVGTGILYWVVETDQPWLEVTPTSGSSSVEIDTVTVTVSRTSVLPGDYNGVVTVVSTDVDEDIPVTMTVLNRSPNIPSNPTPQHGAINLTSSDPNLAIPLKWQGGDPDGDAVTYTVYLGTNPSPPQVAAGLGDTVYTPNSLQGHTTYYWQVVANDGHEITAGPVWQFSTANRSPYVPNTPTPVNGASGQPLTASLAWSGGDPDDDTVSYEVYFGAEFNPPLVASNITAVTYDPPGDLQVGNIYYWRIVATDGTDTSSSPVWEFRTLSPDLSTSHKEVSHEAAPSGGILTYTLSLANSGQLDAVGASLTDTLPTEATWFSNLTWTGGGNASYDNGIVTWSGNIAVGQSALITYQLQLNDTLPDGVSISNIAYLDDDMGQVISLETSTAIDNTPPTVTVISPNGNESWDPGNTYYITWSASDANLGVNAISIYYSSDGGLSWVPIASGVTNTGVYPWTTPNDGTEQALVGVAALDKAGNRGWDQSDASFNFGEMLPEDYYIYLPIVLRSP
ncbi:MAG: choice-of-anchor D domain-containing protein, partial [Chloroflexi bacterium]|nr:choice-of-anchor D domain-containing protein [Chloroflexota bacterium]